MPVGNRGLSRFSGPQQPGLFPWSQSVHGSGTLAQRPTPGPATAGMYYLTTDGGFVYRSNGQAWVQVAPNNEVCILTDASSVNLDLAAYCRFYLQMTSAVGATRGFTLVTSASIGQVGNAFFTGKIATVNNIFWELILVQPASGGPCTISSYGQAGILWSGGGAPTLTTSASKTDFLAFQYVGGLASPYFGFVLGQNF